MEIVSTWIIPIVVGVVIGVASTLITNYVEKNRKKAIIIGIVMLIIALLITRIATTGLVEVPNIVNLHRNKAIEILKKNGLDAAIIEEWSNDYEQNQIIYQDPIAFTKIKKGTKVSIGVSKGSRLVVLPSFLQMSYIDAEEWIKKNDLIHTTEYVKSSEEEKRLVLSQDPSIGAKIFKGDTVKISVGDGQNPNKRGFETKIEGGSTGLDTKTASRDNIITLPKVELGQPTEEIALQKVEVNGDKMTIEFSNWASNCVELLSKDGKKIGDRNTFCKNGSDLKISKYEHMISPGDTVRLCERLNSELRCTPIVKVTGLGRKITLSEVRINDEGLTIVYSKNFETCAHLKSEFNSSFFSNGNPFCKSGENISIFLPKASYENDFKIGQLVKLCHGNNGRCTDLIAIQ